MSSYYVEARQQLYPQKGKKSAQKAKLSRSWSKYKVANSAVPLIDKYQYKATYVWNTHFDNAKWNTKTLFESESINQSSINPLDFAILAS